MSFTRCLTKRYPWCTLYTRCNNVPPNGMTARYLRKLLTGRKRMNVERATSMLGWISNKKMESLNLDPRVKKLLLNYEDVFSALPPPLSC